MSIATQTARHGLSTTTARVVSSYLKEHKALGRALSELPDEGWVPEAVESLAQCVPIPPTCSAFIKGSFFRLPESVRCFYYSPTALGEESSDAPVTQGVIALKGLEPLAADFDALLTSRRLTPDHILERFAITEGKAPCTVTLREAEKDARCALDLQLRHLEVYGTLARLPVPLLTFRYDDEVSRPIIEACRRNVSRRGFEAIRPALEEGIGGYAYFYPSFPIRTNQLDFALPAGAWVQRSAALALVGGAEKVVDRWAQGFARILYLGYLPATLASFDTGNLCQPQNSVIDGGFVDVDSVFEMRALESDAYFYDSLQYAVTSLFRSVYTLLVQHPGIDTALSQTFAFRGNALYGVVTQFLTARLRRALETEARPGLTLDPRILSYFDEAPTFESLSRRLAAFRPERSMESLAGANQFLQLQAQLLNRLS